MVQGIVIPAADAQDLQALELVELEDYQRAVGGWVEALDIFGFGCTMYLNEEGFIRGPPYNGRGHLPVVVSRAARAGSGAACG